uniref:CDP-diacylglycerol--inositol 3-phosphatidyltransferase n=1 Tax=Solanum lycopersicum TaxID=4081 RepID=A0A3Q7HH48_SOLLC
MAGKSRPKPLNVYLYIPNIIGYLRILMNCVAFAVCFVDKKLFSLLYFVSSKALASCDVWLLYSSFAHHTAIGTITGHQLVQCCGMTEFDGICNPIGRKHTGGAAGKRFSSVQANIFLNNESGSGKTRVRELCIKGLALPACWLFFHRPGLVFLSLLALDISSHWLQMYSTFLVGKTSHKDVKDSSSWLFRLYYGNRMFMGYCCVSCEVLYITLFLLARKETESLIDVLVNTATASWIYLVLLALLLFGWAIKQFVNVIQMKTAADACVLYDMNKKQ